MKSGFVRAVVALVAGALLAVAAPGLAAAGTADGGKGSSSTEAVGQRLLELRDQLATEAYAGDVQGTRNALAELDPVLAGLAGGAVHDVRSEARNQAAVAKAQQEKVSDALADPAAQPRTYAQEGKQLPPLPGPLSMVNGLLQSLLETLQGLLASLLGPVPSLPVPAQ